jgi:hypothetical protein
MPNRLQQRAPKDKKLAPPVNATYDRIDHTGRSRQCETFIAAKSGYRFDPKS